MKDFDAWLHELSTEPLPGGVSAAAVASSMGAALVAKVVRISLQRQAMGADECTVCKSVRDLACAQQQVLLDLAEADERAYLAVLDSEPYRDRGPGAAGAWREATDVPISVAEACHLLLRRLPLIRDVCWPAVRPDLEIGQWLLEVGLRAGLSAAESNLRAWADHEGFAPLQARMDALG